MKKSAITHHLRRNKGLFILWAVVATFGAYFCTYAFRKPYTSGTFQGFAIGQMEYKTIAIIAQVVGYMISKFIGVKVISELKPRNRIKLIVFLIMIAMLSLILFAYVRPPYNVFFMFMNGLPLGMVWGVIFSFLEGRRFTELLSMALSINMIITSGILKTIYLEIQSSLLISDFEMPLVMGSLFFPFFLLSVWMLSKLPPPDYEEKIQKLSRKAMTKFEKQTIWRNYSMGLLPIILFYALLTTLRDFRDNFAVEIWGIISPGESIQVFAKTESLIGVIVMALIALLVLIKNNKLAFNSINVAMILGISGLFLSTILYRENKLSPTMLMVSQGITFYLPYLLIQIAFFERLIPVLQIKSNASYLVYLCDSVGYLGSVLLLFYKEFFANGLNYEQLLIRFSQVAGIGGLVLVIGQYIFFSTLISNKHKTSRIVQTAN